MKSRMAAGERSSARDHMGHHAFGHLDLAVGEQLDRQRHQQGLVRRPQFKRQQRAEARCQIGQRDRPRGGRASAPSAAAARPAPAWRTAPAHARAIRGIEILHHQRAVGGPRQSARLPAARRPASPPRSRARWILPRGRRPIQRHRRRRPVGPGIEKGDGLRVAGRDDEIGARHARCAVSSGRTSWVTRHQALRGRRQRAQETVPHRPPPTGP